MSPEQSAHLSVTATMDLSANHASISTTNGNVLSHNTVVNHYYDSEDISLIASKIIKWSLYSAKYRTFHNEAHSSRNHNTGKYFFKSDTYKNWVEGKKRNLECFGKPGAGKTSTASAVVEDLLAQSTRSSEPWIVLYAYFRHDSLSCQTAPIVFCNFLGQIVANQRQPSPRIQKLYDYYIPLGNTVPTLKEIKPILKDVILSSKCSFIVVDALDEFYLKDPNSSAELVRGLEELGANLLITSRYPDNFAPGTFSQIQISANDDDLIIYIRDQLANMSRLKKFFVDFPELEDEIIEGICQKCDGMFIIARLLVDSFSSSLNAKTIRKTLQTLPNGLDDTYHYTMKRIDSQSEELRDIGRSIIKWVVFAKVKFKVAELRHAISFKAGMESISEEDLVPEGDITSLCGGLVVISDGYAQIVHYSAQQFFLQSKHAEQYFPDAQRTIADTCLHYLNLSASTTSPGLISKGYKLQQRRLMVQEILDTFPLAQYAATHWGSHAFHAQASFDSSLVGSFYRFPLSPYIANVDDVQVLPTDDMAPLHYQILYCAIFGLALPTLLGLMEIPMPGGIDFDVERICIDPNIPMDSGENRPLHFAARLGHRPVLKLLIKANADVDAHSKSGATPLSYAAQNGHSGIVELLLDSRADPTIAGHHQETPLSHASENGHTEVVRILLSAGVDPNTAKGDIWTPLAYAARGGHSAIVTMLLKRGADPCIADRENPLVHASRNGYTEVVRMLLSAGAGSNIAHDHQQMALDCAAWKGYSEIVKMLLEREADHSVADHGHETLSYASRNGQTEVVKILLNAGANPNITDNYRLERTPLAYASQGGHSKIVEMLLDGGADHSVADCDQETPLSHASQNGHIEVVRILLNAGADPNIADNHQRFSLAYAARGGYSEIVEMLLEREADHSVADHGHETPLSYASRNGHTEVVRILLRTGADPNVAIGDNWTPLACAARGGHFAIVGMLLERKADPSIAGYGQGTLLSDASRNGQIEVVGMLLSAGADPNIADKHQRFPLSYAAQGGHSGVVKMLLVNGTADHSVADRDQRTPLSYASQNGHTEVVKILLNAGADPNVADNCKRTPLAYAAKEGHAGVITILRDSGTNLDVVDGDMRTPLSYASQKGHSEAVKVLLAGDADLNIVDNDKRTPVAHAALEGQLGTIKLLLDGGADPNAVDGRNQTSLSHAAQNKHTQAVGMLMDAGANPNVVVRERHGSSSQDWTPLSHAAQLGHPEVVSILLQKGADPNIALGDQGMTSLSYAALNGNSEIVRMLVDGGADPNVAHDGHMSPLFCAVRKGHPDIVKILLKGGANPDIAGSDGKKPLDDALEIHSRHSKDVLAAAYTRIEWMLRNHRDGPTKKYGSYGGRD